MTHSRLTRVLMIVRPVLVIAGTTAALSAQGGPPKRPEIPPPAPYRFPTVVERTLPNGLRVAVLERHDLPMVVTRVVMAGGALADPPGKEGTFTLMRQLLNDPTAARPIDSLARRFADMGNIVDNNGFIARTVNFDSSLAILAEMIRNPAFVPTSVERVRATRLAGARMLRSEGNFLTTRLFTSVLFGATHPFARFESEESLARISRDDLVALHASRVRPPNLTLVIVGDVTPAAVFARVERFFGDWPRGTGAALDINPASAASGGPPATAIYLVDVPAPTAYIRIASLSAPRTSADVPALDVMNAVFGALTGSRLHREIRERRGLAYGAPSAFQWRATPTPSVFYATLSSVAPARTDSAIAVLLDELKGIAGTKPPTDAEFEFGKTNRIASLPLQLETQEAMATRLTELIQQQLPLDYFGTYVAGLRSVTPNQVVAAAKKHVDPAHTVIAVVGNAAVLEPLLRAMNLAPVHVLDANGQRIR